MEGAKRIPIPFFAPSIKKRKRRFPMIRRAAFSGFNSLLRSKNTNFLRYTHHFFLFLEIFMKNTTSIIKDLLLIIERQEKELKSSSKIIVRNEVEIERLKSTLKESQSSNQLLTQLAKESLDCGEKLASFINKKQGNKGNNSFFAGNN